MKILNFSIIALLTTSSAYSAVLFDYGPTGPQTGFTQINNTTGTGTSDGISISNNGDGLEFRDRTTQINDEGFGSHPQFNLLSDIAFENDAATIVFTLTGLTAFAEYTVVGYGYDADFANNSVVNDWTTNGGTVSHGWENDDITTARFEMANLTADINGEATITGAVNSGTAIIIWNGFEISEIPEPSSAALLGLAGLALLRRRR